MMRLLFATLTLAAAIALTLPLHAATRTWTSADGSKQVEAQFVEAQQGKVTLRRADGRTVTVPIDSLSEADRDFISRQADATEPDPPGGDQQGVRVEVVGLSIGKPTPKIPEDEQSVNFGFMFFGPREGTQLRVWIYSPERTMLGIDDQTSELSKLTDDKQTDLTKGIEKPAARNPLAALMGQGSSSPFSTMVSEHKRSCVVTIQGDGIPAAGAEQVTVDATIALLCGVDPVTVEAPAVKLEEGHQFVTGDMTWTVHGWETDIGLDNADQVVMLSTEQSVAVLESIELLDDQGKPIATTTLEAGVMDPAEGGDYTLGIPENREVLGLRVTYYSKVETVKVPVKVTTGVGW